MKLFIGARVVTSPDTRWWGLQHEGRLLSVFLVLKLPAR